MYASDAKNFLLPGFVSKKDKRPAKFFPLGARVKARRYVSERTSLRAGRFAFFYSNASVVVAFA